MRRRRTVTPPQPREERLRTILDQPAQYLNIPLAFPKISTTLSPFLAPDTVVTLYDRSAYLHCFGHQGPTSTDWTNLFNAATGLCAETITILVALTVLGGPYESTSKDLMRLLLGTDDIPGILMMVCDKFDEWCVSMDRLARLIGQRAEECAQDWSIERADGCYVWKCARLDGQGEQLEEWGMGDAVRKIGERVAIQVAHQVSCEAMSRVTLEGTQNCLNKLHMRGRTLAWDARAKVQNELFNQLFQITNEEEELNRV